MFLLLHVEFYRKKHLHTIIWNKVKIGIFIFVKILKLNFYTNFNIKIEKNYTKF